MIKQKKIAKYVSITLTISFLVSEFLNLLFQVILHHYYVRRAKLVGLENEQLWNQFFNTAKNFKHVGVVFSNIGNILFVLLVFLFVFYIALNLYCYIMNKNKSE